MPLALLLGKISYSRNRTQTIAGQRIMGSAAFRLDKKAKSLPNNPYLKQFKKSKEDIVLEYASTVKYIARRLAARLPAGFEEEDLIQVGMVGLMEAADRFDPRKENQFKTYAEFRIRGAMLDDLRARDWIPRSVRENAAKLERAYTALRGENISEPTDDQLADRLGIDLKNLQDLLVKSRPIPLLKIEDLGNPDGSEDGLNFLETLSDPDEEDPVDKILGGERREELAKAIKKLPEKERLVLSLYYNEDLNLKEIAAVLDLTESRVSQIRTKAVAMLRSLMREFIQA